MTDISNKKDVRELLADVSLTTEQKVNVIFHEAIYLMDQIDELESDAAYARECYNCEEMESEIENLKNNMLDPSDAIIFRVISVTDKELILENHLSPGETYTWVSGKELGLVQDV